MGRRGRASACPRSRTGQVIWLAAALLLLAVAVLALWLYETNGAPDGQSAETRQVPPIPPAGGEAEWAGGRADGRGHRRRGQHDRPDGCR